MKSYKRRAKVVAKKRANAARVPRENFIQKLPEDVLVHIFHILVNPEDEDPVRPQELAQVCRTWRGIVNEISAFWQDFCILLHWTPKQLTAYWSTMSSRVKDRPVTLNLCDTPWADEHQLIVKTLRQLMTTAEVSIDAIFFFILKQPRPFPIVSYLELFTKPVTEIHISPSSSPAEPMDNAKGADEDHEDQIWYDDEHLHLNIGKIFEVLPQTKKLFLEDIVISWSGSYPFSPWMAGLEELSLSVPRYSIIKLWGALGQCRCLERLTLHGYFVAGDEPTSNSSPPESLRAIILENLDLFRHPDQPTQRPVLANLNRLAVHDASGPGLENFLEDHPGITYLEAVSGTEMTEARISGLLPDLETLHSRDFDYASLHSKSPQGNWLFTNLIELQLLVERGSEDFEGLELTILRRMVRTDLPDNIATLKVLRLLLLDGDTDIFESDAWRNSPLLSSADMSITDGGIICCLWTFDSLP